MDAVRHSRPRMTLAILSIGGLAFALMQSMTVPVIPQIQAEFHTDQSAVTWVLTAFLLSASVFTPIAGRIGDGIGKHRMFAISLGFLAVGSLIGALAPNITVLIIGRVVTGIGGGVVPLSFGIIRDELPGSRVAGAAGFVSSLLAVGFGAGIVVAGPIVDLLGYRWLFWLPCIVTAAAGVMAVVFIPPSPVRMQGRPPAISALMLAAWLVPLLLGISQAPQVGWTSVRTLALLSTAAALFAAWIAVERRVAFPLIDMPMMQHRGVWTSNAMALLVGAAMYAVFTFLPQFLQTPSSTGYGLGLDMTASGLVILPHATASFVAGLVAAPLGRRIGQRRVIAFGCMVGAAGVALIVLFHDSPLQIAAANLVLGFGISAVFASLAPLVLASVPREQSGVAAGMNNNIRSVGGAVGASLMSTVVTSHLAAGGYPTEAAYLAGFGGSAALLVVATVIALLIPRSSVGGSIAADRPTDRAAAPVPKVQEFPNFNNSGYSNADDSPDRHTVTERTPVDLAARISTVMEVDADSPAISQDGRWDTWGDLVRLGADLDEKLSTVPSDAFIALIGRNDVATVGTLLWGLSTSRPILLVNNMQPDAALAEELLDLRPGAVVAVAADWERPGVLDAATRSGALVLRVERAPSASAEVLSTATSHRESALTPSNPDCAVSLKTSGTTGPPKRVEVTRRSLSASIDAVDRHHGNGGAPQTPQLRRGATIQMLSLGHTSAIQSICVTITAGRQLVLLERFEPRAWGEAVRDHDVVTTGVPPAALRMILDADIDPRWLKGLRSARSGSAPLDPVLAEEFERRYGVAVLQAYGATELQALASWTLKDHRELRVVKRGAVGRVHPGVEVRVVDAQSGDQLPVGSSGLLEVRTAQSSAASDPNAWIRTSDIARYDDDGFLWILGRADGTINRGGFKVDPAAIADELRSHPAIADAAVVALPDARLGHVPVAAVEVVAGSTRPTEGELRTWLRGRIEPYKVPTAICVLDALPRTIAMKPDAEAIRRLATDQSSVDAV